MVASELLWVDNSEPQDITRLRVRAHCARYTSQRHLERKLRQQPQHTRNLLAKAISSCHDDAAETSSVANANSKEPTFSQAEETERHQEQCSGSVTIPVAWHGNSDPFACQAIKLTARVNRLINFFVNIWVPAKCWRGDEQITGGPIRDLHTHYFASVLHSEEGVTGAVLLCATILSRLGPCHELERQQAGIKLYVIQRLKNVLAVTSQDKTVEDNAIWLTHALMINAVSGHCMSEAKFHGDALQHLWQKKTARDGMKAVSPKILFQVLSYEIYRAGLTFTPSCFDMQRFLPAVFEAHFPGVQELLRSVQGKQDMKLDTSILGTPLQEMCTELFNCMWIWTTVAPKDPKLSARLADWEILRSYYRQLQLVEYYLVARDRAAAASPSSSQEARYWHAQACTALSLLLCYVFYISDPCVGGRSYWPLGEHLSHALEVHLTKAVAESYHSRSEFSSACLFAAWTGATWTFKNSACPNEGMQESYYFRTFFLLSSGLGLHTWDQISAVIAAFLPTPIPEEQRGTEFQKMLMSLPVHSREESDFLTSTKLRKRGTEVITTSLIRARQ